MNLYDVVLMVIGICFIVFFGRLLLLEWWAERTSARRRLVAADQRLFREFENARRAMNDAAGQSWRNLAD